MFISVFYPLDSSHRSFRWVNLFVSLDRKVLFFLVLENWGAATSRGSGEELSSVGKQVTAYFVFWSVNSNTDYNMHILEKLWICPCSLD